MQKKNETSVVEINKSLPQCQHFHAPHPSNYGYIGKFTAPVLMEKENKTALLNCSMISV